MWEYASVFSVARHTGLDPYIPRCLRKVLEDVFSGLSVPDIGAIGHCPVHWHWQDAAHEPENWVRNNQSIVLPRFVILPEMVLTWVSDIRQEFRFRKKLQEHAQNVLRAAARGRRKKSTTVFIGVHVRRSDYINYLWRTRHIQAANETFFKRAMKYFRDRYESALFIVVSDDVPWCRQKLLPGTEGDVVLGSAFGTKQGNNKGGTTAGQDLATLAACNHSIIDYGTFGVWGAILAGGETIVYNISQHSSVRIADLLPFWQVLST